MSDPIRLLSAPSSGDDDLGRELLSSARSDQASAEAEERALAMLGLTAASLAAASTGATGASSTSITASTGASFAPSGLAAGAAQSAMPTALKLSGLAFVKWVGVGVIAVAAAAGTYRVVTSPSPSSIATAPAQARAVDESSNDGKKAVAGSSPRETVAAKPADTQTEQPSVATTQEVTLDDVPAAAAKPAREVVPAAAAASAPSLSGELTLLDKARAAIAQHDAVASASALDEYARRYPNGTMREEATVARIETLLLAGQSSQASAQAEQFLREHPSSTNTKRVRQLYKRAQQDQ